MNERMKILRQLLALSCLLLAPTTAWAQGSKGQTFESAREAVAHMRVGWNLGNTLDSNSGDTLHMWIEAEKNRTVSTYETAWGQRVTTAPLFKMFKEAGFNAIRVPVTWYPHMEASFSSVRGYSDRGTWKYTPWLPSADDIGKQIQRDWMRRVHEVVAELRPQDKAQPVAGFWPMRGTVTHLVKDKRWKPEEFVLAYSAKDRRWVWPRNAGFK